jgi:hypothetical protein
VANPHFANLGDVWNHLLLTEVIEGLRPECYVETHAGSASYRLVGDVERGLGAEMFLSASSDAEPLRSSPYRRHVLASARGAEPSYPGFAAAGDVAAWPRVPICLLRHGPSQRRGPASHTGTPGAAASCS